MDPDETLKAIREAIAALEAHRDTLKQAIEYHENLADAFDALDAWLVRGGFLPREWQRQK